MLRSDLSILAEFLAIAEERSFTKVARRLGVSPSAMSHAIRGLEHGPTLARFTRGYPDVILDITADYSRLDNVAGGFDAGIHFGEYIQTDMIAVCVSRDHRAAIVGAPECFQSHPQAEDTARSSQASLHQLPARNCRCVSLGVRQRQEVSFRCGERASYR